MGNNVLVVGEMKEFSGFSQTTQSYIGRSLDVALDGENSPAIAAHYGIELRAVHEHRDYYRFLKVAKDNIPYEADLPNLRGFFDNLVISSTYDLSQGSLPDFPSYRFLYERLLTADARPWLVSAFCAAAGMPNIHPNRRRDLFQSLSEKAATAPGWSGTQPVFFPRWIEPDTP